MSLPLSQDSQTPDIKRMPQERSVRDAIRRLAAECASAMPAHPTRELLEAQATLILNRLALPCSYLGFAMVAVSNACWHAPFAAVPYQRRLLLLPHCLSHQETCAGRYDSVGLHCAGCGHCTIHGLQSEAESLGYQVIVAEGTSSVLMKILDGEADAILGVACLDSLEKSFARIVELGIPHLAVPLLQDGCANTEAECDQITAYLHARGEPVDTHAGGYLPLLRETRRMFAPQALSATLAPFAVRDAVDPLTTTDAMAVEWLLEGGKRLRPFVTIAAYAVARHGDDALEPGGDLSSLIPPAVQRVALAIETLHKASLVHDDIEDGDTLRYGQPTLHQQHGTASAINTGDFLVGLGYRLIAGEASTLGAACVADILTHLANAHLDLCRGQGAELLWQQRRAALRPIDALSIYALKTAPAFEAALYAGLRAADVTVEATLLKRFSIYLGEAYQVRNDLDDWDTDGKAGTRGRDALAGRPTILRAFALQAGGDAAMDVLNRLGEVEDPGTVVDTVEHLYQELGAFDQCARLLDKLRTRALALAEEVDVPALQALLDFLVRITLPKTPHVRRP